MKLAFLDKDGTLTTPKSGHTFVQSPDDQVLLPNVEQRINELVEAGYTLVVVSNQAGVEKGFKSLTDAIEEMRYLMRLLPQIQVCYFCPDMEGRECWKVTEVGILNKASYRFYYRKPEVGMVKQAVIDFDYNFSADDCLLIGDRPEDQECASNAAIRFIDAAEWRDNGI